MPEIMDELKGLLEKQGKAFEEFKAANDERLKSIEAKGTADPMIEEKVNKINEALAKLEGEILEVAKKANRPPQGGDSDAAEAKEHRKDFGLWMRKGGREGEAIEARLREHERKASLNTISPEDGGVTVPTDLDRNVSSLLQNDTPMRGVANVITVGGANYEKLFNLHGAASGWVGETETRPATTNPQFAKITPYMGELYAMPMATQTMLDDSFFDVEGWLLGELRDLFAMDENTAFTSGNGVNKPKGFLAYPTATTADGSRAFGTFQYIATGVAADFAASAPQDILLDLVYAMKAGYLTNARYMLNLNTLKTVRKWKDGEGNYIWQPNMQAGEPALINGYPFTINADMPDVGAGTLPIAFGDFRRAYKIVDRIGTRVLRDPLTNKPYVMFYTTKRVGGMVEDTQALKLVKIAAS